MQTQLAKDEQIVKSWNYSVVKSKKGMSKNTNVHELTVTNKRIIRRQTDKFGASVEEIYLKDVKSVSGGYGKKTSVLWLILFCALAATCMAVAFATKIYYLLAGTAIFAIIGALLYMFNKKYVFLLRLETYGVQSNALDIAIGTLAPRRKKREASSYAVKVVIDHESAKEIVNTLGALILDNRD